MRVQRKGNTLDIYIIRGWFELAAVNSTPEGLVLVCQEWMAVLGRASGCLFWCACLDMMTVLVRASL